MVTLEVLTHVAFVGMTCPPVYTTTRACPGYLV